MDKKTYNHKRVYLGKLPRKRDIVDWGDTKLLQCVKFVDFFVREGRFTCNQETINTAYLRSEDELFWDEFLDRINMRLDNKDFTELKFRNRLMNFSRVPLAWLKQNPSMISDEMKVIMEKNERMKWALESFKDVDTELGISVVEMNQDENTNEAVKNVVPSVTNVKSPDAMYQQTLLNLVSLASRLSKGVKEVDIKEMKASERIKLAATLATVLSRAMSGNKPNIGRITQININKSNRDDLENAIREYAGTQN